MLTNALDTSINAYESHRGQGRARLQCLRILNHLRACAGDWSIGELAEALDMEKSTVSARVHELLHGTRELVAKPKRKDRVSGVRVRPVALAPEQLALRGGCQ